MDCVWCLSFKELSLSVLISILFDFGLFAMCYRPKAILTSKLKYVGRLLCKCQHKVRLLFVLSWHGQTPWYSHSGSGYSENNDDPGDLNENKTHTHTHTKRKRSYFFPQNNADRSEFLRIFGFFFSLFFNPFIHYIGCWNDQNIIERNK